MFKKGDKVRNVYTDDVFVVKSVCWQNYEGRGRQQTVEFEPAMSMGVWQPTPWDTGDNLQIITN
jgi:hypothetical protein